MNITRGKIISAVKTVIYGPEGIGKSTLAAQFPDPLFIDTEGSTKQLDTARMDKPTSWEMLKQQVEFARDKKPCKTLIIDTIDWAESLCIAAVCDRYGKKGIEDFGYGNGYVYEKEEFGKFLNLLTEVIDSGVNVTLIAHAALKKFEQPDEMGAYDRWEMKLGKKTTSLISPLVKEWGDMVLFANYKTISVAVDKDGKKHKAQGGKRVILTTHHPCWDAKNRFSLPDEIPMEYEQIRHILERSETKQNVFPMPDAEFVPPPADFTKPAAEAFPEQPENIQESESSFSNIPKALSDLMAANNVTEAEIRKAVSQRGYYTKDTPIENYDPEFIYGVLIDAWGQVFEMINENRYPF